MSIDRINKREPRPSPRRIRLQESGVTVTLAHGVGLDTDLYFDNWPCGGGYVRIVRSEWAALRDAIASFEREVPARDAPDIEQRRCVCGAELDEGPDYCGSRSCAAEIERDMLADAGYDDARGK